MRRIYLSSDFGKAKNLAISILAIICILLWEVTLWSKASGSIDVPDEYATIQAGIDAASDGDTVLVADGTYTGLGNVNLDFEGKAITVRSESGAENCVIDCDGAEDTRGFHFHSGEGADSVVMGFTIRNGNAENGGGIACHDNSSPTIVNNVITESSAELRGGGIYCHYSAPRIENNTIAKNSAGKAGGGIMCYYYPTPYANPEIISNTITGNSGSGITCTASSPRIVNNIITGNSNDYGGGIYCSVSSGPNIVNSNICDNVATITGGGIFSWESHIALANTILWGNSPEQISFHPAGTPSTATISYSDIQDGQAGIVTNNNGTVDWLDGNIDSNPAFLDAANGDYHLLTGSPCIDSGTSEYAHPDDRDGNPRDAKPDMGAYEFIQVDGLAMFKVRLHLTQGTNIVSLPLRPEHSYTASSLAAELGSTIVIRVENESFDAYVHPEIGTDFPIEMGKGYIVNLKEAQTFDITGWPWGIPAAPSTGEMSRFTWAFVVAGWVDRPGLTDAKVRVTNARSRERMDVSISPSGVFTAAFVDMSKNMVVAEGDEVITQIVDMNGFPLTEARRHIISHGQINSAYLLTALSATPKTRLLQNYPNPFNPETWMPFQLGDAAQVEIEIRDLNGSLVRHFDLGHREAGWYFSKEQAAYWDGKNEMGEYMASGVYFYSIRAGDFTDMRKLTVLR